jgi:hypothetical protein
MKVIKTSKATLLIAIVGFAIAISCTSLFVLNNMGLTHSGRQADTNKTILTSATFENLDTAAMTNKADVIVLGSIKEVQPAYKGIKFTKEIRDKLRQGLTEAEAQLQEEDESNKIYTNAIIEVDTYLKTDSAIDTSKKKITIRLLGGTAEGITQEVSRFPKFEKKDENQPVLLFLGRSFDGILQPFTQGTFKIKGNKAINDNFTDKNLEMPTMLDKIKDNTQ